MSNPQRKTSPDGLYPSPATLFHTRLRDSASYDAVRQGFMKVLPLFWLRDGRNVRKIQKAETLEELLALASQASGLAEFTWHDRLAEFGDAALPAMTERLRQSRGDGGTDEDRTIDRMIGEMRWRGQAGAQALQGCFASLDDYGQSLACMVLGLLGAREAADAIWEYYQRVRYRADAWYFIAALWGLVDLQDRRACPALLEWLEAGDAFYELFGFLSLVGDEIAITPLLRIIDQVEERDRYNLMMTAAAIGQRIGGPALQEAILSEAGQDEVTYASSIVERLLAVSPADIQKYFEVFYRGFQSEDTQVLGSLAPTPQRGSDN